MILSRREQKHEIWPTRREPHHFREIIIGFDSANYQMLKLFDQKNNSERHLILLGMELSKQLYLKDVDIDFTAEPLSPTIVNSPTNISSLQLGF